MAGERAVLPWRCVVVGILGILVGLSLAIVGEGALIVVSFDGGRGLVASGDDLLSTLLGFFFCRGELRLLFPVKIVYSESVSSPVMSSGAVDKLASRVESPEGVAELDMTTPSLVVPASSSLRPPSASATAGSAASGTPGSAVSGTAGSAASATAGSAVSATAG